MGDFCSNQESNSDSSSPTNSNGSTEEELERHQTEHSENAFASKPIYNFSIPDIIKHDSHKKEDQLLQQFIEEEAAIVKQNIIEQDLNEHESTFDTIVPSKRRRKSGANNVASNILSSQDDLCIEPKKHKRKRLAIDKSNPTMSPAAPPVIDLTDASDVADSFPCRENLDTASGGAHSDSEIGRDSVETRPLCHSESGRSFHDVVSNLERYRQRLQESRERMQELQRKHNYRLSHLRHRRKRSRSSPRISSIVTDGPLITDPMSPDGVPVPVITSTMVEDEAPPVITLEEDDAETESKDGDTARRMAQDPSYSPPYLTPEGRGMKRQRPPYSHHPYHSRRRREKSRERASALSNRLARNSRHIQSLPDIGHSVHARWERYHRIGMEVRQRMSRLQNRINVIRQSIAPETPPSQHQCAGDRVEQESASNVNRSTEVAASGRFNDESASTAEDGNARAEATATEDYDEGEVEFIGAFPRFNTQSENTLQSEDNIPRLPSLSSPIFYPNEFRRQSPIPDFLAPLVNTVISRPLVPRLHHYEDYEALWSLAEQIGPAKPRGLSKIERDKIHSFRFTAGNAKETNMKCVVCLSDYVHREKLRRLPCNHDFHAKCIDKWLKGDKTCPVCRNEVKKEDL